MFYPGAPKLTRSLLASLLILGCAGRPEPPPPPGPELVGVWYTVKAGDSVFAIAKAHALPPEDLIELNGLSHPDRLEPGQALFLYGVEELLRRKAKTVAPPQRSSKRKGKSRFVWPMRAGTLTSRYGPRGRRIHKGIDIGAKPGTPIYAAAAGTVVYSDDKQRGYGNLVILKHAGGWATVYAHNRRNLVDEGDTVRQGAPIAEVGSTGRSTGPHLHFEVRRRGKAVDPLKQLPKRGRR